MPHADTAIAAQSVTLIELPVHPLEPAAFAPFGQVVAPTVDGKSFDADDAQLELSRGTPRFYIMSLNHRDLTFRVITRHLAVTQVLASVGGKPWLIAVAPPDHPDDPTKMPDPKSIMAFRVPGTMAIKLHRGTWHAGPFFDDPQVDFFNLELADTNVTDHFNCHLDRSYGLAFRFKS
jgi:ureidoglycolate lyase